MNFTLITRIPSATPETVPIPTESPLQTKILSAKLWRTIMYARNTTAIIATAKTSSVPTVFPLTATTITVTIPRSGLPLMISEPPSLTLHSRYTTAVPT